MNSGNIGNCDTCEYVLKCNRASIFSVSLMKQLYGCPKNLIEEAERDRIAYDDFRQNQKRVQSTD